MLEAPVIAFTQEIVTTFVALEPLLVAFIQAMFTVFAAYGFVMAFFQCRDRLQRARHLFSEMLMADHHQCPVCNGPLTRSQPAVYPQRRVR